MINLLASINGDVINVPWWGWAIIVVVVLAILMILPSNFLKKDKKNKNKKGEDVNPLENKTETSDALKTSVGFIDRSSDFEKAKPTPKKEKPLLGVFNGVGHKTAIRMKSLVYVYPEHDSCELCRPFEGKILSIDPVDNEVVTMSEAISKGYHHIGCKHMDVDYYPKETKIPESPWTEKEQESFHKKVTRLFRLENDLRILIFNIDNGSSKNIENDKLKVNHLKEQIVEHCEKNNLSYSEERFSPYLTDTIKFKYLPIEEGEKK